MLVDDTWPSLPRPLVLVASLTIVAELSSISSSGCSTCSLEGLRDGGGSMLPPVARSFSIGGGELVGDNRCSSDMMTPVMLCADGRSCVEHDCREGGDLRRNEEVRSSCRATREMH